MLSDDVSIKASHLGKKFSIYRRPLDRLVHLLFPWAKNRYKEFWALKDISFSIRKGETVGIIGTNGSGKSTLLQLLYGTLTPSKGEVETSGLIVALLELGAGFNLEFTGRENVFLNANLLGYPQDRIKEKMVDIIRFSELEEYIDQPVKTYSSGMFARLAFSVAIHVDPDILFIDETLSVGDARFINKCMKKIMEMKATGVTILFVSHDVNVVRSLCERVIWIDRGHIVAQGDVFEITGQYIQKLLTPPDLGKSSPKSSDSLRPIVHWGSHLGIVKSAYINDSNGEHHLEFEHGERIRFVMEVAIPQDISRETLSFAFSVKDLKGLDIISKNVPYQAPTGEPIGVKDEQIRVSFEFENILNRGKYSLACAVENVQGGAIDYYEYAEGFGYFSSVVRSERRMDGLVHPKIATEIRSQFGSV